MTRIRAILPAVFALVLGLAIPAFGERDGNGGFSLPSNAFSSPVSGGTLTASDAVAVWSDIETAIAGSVAADGQTTMTGDLKMGANQLVNVGAGSARTDGLNLGQAQDSAMRWGGIAGGTGNALTLSVTPAITAYADGQTFWFISSAANTGAATVNINSVGADTIVTRDGDALVSGDIEADAVYAVTYYNSNFYLWSPAPQLSLYAALASANTFTAAQTINLTSGSTALTLESNDASATGVQLTLTHDSASPADADVAAVIGVAADDDGGASDTIAQIQFSYDDVTATTEDASILFRPMVAGTRATSLTVGPGVTVGSATGGDPGAGKVNATGYQIDGAELSNAVAQVVRDSDATYTTITTDMPYDDTIPQNTEGAEILSVAITPQNASSILRIRTVVPHGASTEAAAMQCAIFVDSTAAAIAATSSNTGNSSSMATLVLEHTLTAGSTSARTYKVRCGPEATPTMYINGDAAGRKLGGVMAATLEVEEILP